MAAPGRVSLEDQMAILAALECGESYRSIGARYLLNPVTVGAIGKLHGFQSPRGQRSAEARRGQEIQQTEREFQDAVVEAAGLLGWLLFHPWLSLHSTAGFPDLVLVRPPRVIFAELKRDTGHTTPAQDVWAAKLTACPGVETYLWYPKDWPSIREVLA